LKPYFFPEISKKYLQFFFHFSHKKYAKNNHCG